jgi:hypothetical protein
MTSLPQILHRKHSHADDFSQFGYDYIVIRRQPCPKQSFMFDNTSTSCLCSLQEPILSQAALDVERTMANLLAAVLAFLALIGPSISQSSAAVSGSNQGISNGTCYYGSGQVADPTYIPCGNSEYGQFTCCELKSICLGHNACYSFGTLMKYPNSLN